MKSRVSEGLFFSITLLFSVAILVMSLLSSINVESVGAEISQIESQIELYTQKNAVLTAKSESVMTLYEIESYATNVLGMQRCTPEQIKYVILPPDVN